MRKIKRFKWLCKHNYSMVATHKKADANLWECKNCDNILVHYWKLDLKFNIKLRDLKLSEWKPFPENRCRR